MKDTYGIPEENDRTDENQENLLSFDVKTVGSHNYICKAEWSILMALSKAETKYYISRLYKFLRNGHIIKFEKMRTYCGEILYNPNDKTELAEVRLDHRHKVISTLIHEFLHFNHPTWSESSILKLESAIINSLTDRQIKNIIKRFAEAL